VHVGTTDSKEVREVGRKGGYEIVRELGTEGQERAQNVISQEQLSVSCSMEREGSKMEIFFKWLYKGIV